MEDDEFKEFTDRIQDLTHDQLREVGLLVWSEEISREEKQNE